MKNQLEMNRRWNLLAVRPNTGLHSYQDEPRQATIIQGPDSIWRWRLTSIGNPIVEIRRSYDRLISTMGFPTLVRHLYIESYDRLISAMGFPTLVRRHLYIESAPCCLFKRAAQETTTDRRSPRVAQSRRPVAYFMARAPMQVPHHGLWSIAALKMNLSYASKSEKINFNPPGADVQFRLTHSLSKMLSVKLKYKNFHGIRK